MATITISMAGIPVHATSGVGGGFEIMQNYKVDRKVFSTADLSAILMGLSNLSNMIRGDELVNALAKVKSFIPADRAKDIELKANQILIDLSPWMSNQNVQPYLNYSLQYKLLVHQRDRCPRYPLAIEQLHNPPLTKTEILFCQKLANRLLQCYSTVHSVQSM